MTKVNLKSKINEIRYELSKKMNKSGKNDYSKYDYFQLKDFMPQALELFNEKGIYTEFYISKDKYELPGKTTISRTFNENGEIATETEIKEENFEYKEFAHLLAVNLDDEDDTIELTKETAEVRLQAAQPIQNLGGKTTYMKRYMYMDLLEINENDKVEEETGKPVKVETKTTRKTSKPVVSTVSSTPQTVEPEPAPAPASEQVATDDLMSMETKVELANKIKELGGDPRTDIIEIAKELGTDVPLLKESDKDKVLNMIENRLS
jgi:hypothetical protein